jgi:NADH dehydrogenase
VTVSPDKGTEPKRIETETVIWAAGVKASPLGKKLAGQLGPSVTTDKGGRVAVGPDCSVPGHPELFVVGDLATQPGPDGKPLPGVAPVAMQQGKYVADVIKRRAKGEPPPGPFKYWDKGSMATIGRSRAVLESGPVRLWGYPAWLGWLFIHIMYLARFENRMLVLFQWFWNYVTRNRTALLITGEKAAKELQKANG